MTVDSSIQKEVFQLTVQSGAMPGATWAIGSTPLLIGRSQTCHIVLRDDMVSRTHCSVQRIGDGVRLRDLGSSNPCLLNGKPVSNAALNAGDRLAVGETIFLVSVLRGEGAIEQATPGKADTLRLDSSDVALLRATSSPVELARLPKTAREYATLFQFGLDCAACTDTASLRDRLDSWLRDQFDCAAAWLHEQTMDGLTCLWSTSRAAEPPRKALLEKVAEDGRSRLFGAGDTNAGSALAGEMMVCPLMVGGDTAGLLTILAAGDGRSYVRDDLELLVSMAHVFAPYMRAVAEREELRASNARLRARNSAIPKLIGKSATLHALRLHLQQASLAVDLPVLLLGETGTGKELAAQIIHLGSPRAEREMVVVNCAAIPDDLFESEFFGHVRGAFTGAASASSGLAGLANGSTLFLDEVAELNLANQAKLLRFLELGRYRALGDARERSADVRIVAATNRPLPGDGFRQDLYHRLCGFSIELPPLRARGDDIVLLAEHFRSEIKAGAGATFSPDALAALVNHAWPGNVRELRLRVHRALRTARGSTISAQDLFTNDLPQLSAGGREEQPLRTLAEVEREHITRVLECCNGDTLRAAQVLDIARSTVYKKISEYGLK